MKSAESLQKRIIDTFIQSEEMREYLKLRELPPWSLFEIIAGSLTCLDYKLKWVKELYESDEYHPKIKDYYDKAIVSPKSAISEIELKPNEFFALNENWYDEDILDEKSGSGTEIFASFEKAAEYIYNDMTCDGEESELCMNQLENCCWYTLEKWKLDEEKQEYVNTYTYYLVGTAVVYYRHNIGRLREDRWFNPATELNLPIPFRQGDIVSIDSRPFHPVFPALILAVGDNNDCCCVQGLKIDTSGRWKVGALKHDTFIRDYAYPMVSPLYRLKKNTEKLSDEYDPLIRIAQELKYENEFRKKGKSDEE